MPETKQCPTSRSSRSRRQKGGSQGSAWRACRKIADMKALKHFIVEIRSQTQAALDAQEPHGLTVHDIAVRCIPVIASDGEPCIIYTVNGQRATMGQAARRLKAAADAAD